MGEMMGREWTGGGRWWGGCGGCGGEGIGTKEAYYVRAGTVVGGDAPPLQPRGEWGYLCREGGRGGKQLSYLWVSQVGAPFYYPDSGKEEEKTLILHAIQRRGRKFFCGCSGEGDVIILPSRGRRGGTIFR